MYSLLVSVGVYILTVTARFCQIGVYILIVTVRFCQIGVYIPFSNGKYN